MRKTAAASIGIIAFIAALLMLQLTNPQMVGPVGVLAFFILVYVGCAAGIYLLITSVIGSLERVVNKGKWLVRLEAMSARRVYYYTSFIALAPVILLGMRSVGMVRWTDILLLVLFQVIGLFYISRRF